MAICSSCMHVDNNPENDAACKECVDGSNFEPHAGCSQLVPNEPSKAEIERVLKHIREVCKSNGDTCRGCQFHNEVYNECYIITKRPDRWTFVSDLRTENKIFA